MPALPRRRLLASAVTAVVVAAGLAVVPASPAAAAGAPPTPSGLPAQIEDLQPYIGQAVCDPVAKPGVSAFRDLLLRSYPGSGSYGIVRDCGAGGRSEHKEGRAFDWKVSATSSTQVAQVNALMSWLLATDAQGNHFAMARRLGIMYMIWNRRIWKSYDDRGWQPYDGASAHRDHVHFSFGWNAARKLTSYWDKTVAPLHFGPIPPLRPTPVPSVANLGTVQVYGGTTLKLPATGWPVKVLQQALRMKIDGEFGPETGASVARLQVDHHLPVTQHVGLAEWRALFPAPVDPFGVVDAPGASPGGIAVNGYALDADTTSPIDVVVTLDGSPRPAVTADLRRDDATARYPGLGSAHGFSVPVALPSGTHTICVSGRNATGTPGANASLGCRSVIAGHDPLGTVRAAYGLGAVHVTGWALDPDVADPVTVTLLVDGQAITPTSAPTPASMTARHPGFTGDHGFGADLELADGTHQVCARLANASRTAGTSTTLACRAVTVGHNAQGSLAVVRTIPGGTVSVVGDAYDADSIDPILATIRLDGALVSQEPASGTGPASPGRWVGLGAQHGFARSLRPAPGQHQVCLRAANASGTPGTSAGLGCRSVWVAHPTGRLVSAIRSGRTVTLRGWALDPDTARSLVVDVYVDSSRRAALNADMYRTDVPVLFPGYGGLHGFLVPLGLTPGAHRICVNARNAAGTPGSVRTVGCQTVRVS